MKKSVVVEFENKKHEVEFEDTIKDIQLDGKKLSDSYYLNQQKINQMVKQTWVAQFLAGLLTITSVVGLLLITPWVIKHKKNFEDLIMTQTLEYQSIMKNDMRWKSVQRRKAYNYIRNSNMYWDENKMDWIPNPSP